IVDVAMDAQPDVGAQLEPGDTTGTGGGRVVTRSEAGVGRLDVEKPRAGKGVFSAISCQLLIEGPDAAPRCPTP
ncbi:MAG TPA: hypothetical protein VFH73_08525, partial [Polyangia bacterium]|nr:hypothetical protein [Polyangia bacterium]